jgi:hypothetical protein
MAELSRRVTDLSWSGFARAHAPGALLAAMIGVPALIVAEVMRTYHLGKLATLMAAGVTAAAVTIIALRLRSDLFLGPHGTWASERAGELLQRASTRATGGRAASANGLASVGEANSK